MVKRLYKYLPKTEVSESVAKALQLDYQNNGIDFEAERAAKAKSNAEMLFDEHEDVTEQAASKLAPGVQAEPELVEEIKSLLTADVFSESDMGAYERRISTLTKLQARELLDEVKQEIAKRGKGWQHEPVLPA
ncbi:hypothetical protein [Pontibacter rugosus]